MVNKKAYGIFQWSSECKTSLERQHVDSESSLRFAKRTSECKASLERQHQGTADARNWGSPETAIKEGPQHTMAAKGRKEGLCDLWNAVAFGHNEQRRPKAAKVATKLARYCLLATLVTTFAAFISIMVNKKAYGIFQWSSLSNTIWRIRYRLKCNCKVC